MINSREYGLLSSVCSTAKNIDECMYSNKILDTIATENKEGWKGYLKCAWDNRDRELKLIGDEMFLIIGEHSPYLEDACFLRPTISDKAKIRNE